MKVFMCGGNHESISSMDKIVYEGYGLVKNGDGKFGNDWNDISVENALIFTPVTW